MAICKQKHRDFGIGPINLGGIPNSEVVPNLSSSFVSIRNKPPLLGYLNIILTTFALQSMHLWNTGTYPTHQNLPFISRKPGLRPSSQPYLRNPQSHRSKGLFTPSAKNPTKNVHSPSSFDEFQKIPCFFFGGGGGPNICFFTKVWPPSIALHKFPLRAIATGHSYTSCLTAAWDSTRAIWSASIDVQRRFLTDQRTGMGCHRLGKPKAESPKCQGEVWKLEILRSMSSSMYDVCVVCIVNVYIHRNVYLNHFCVCVCVGLRGMFTVSTLIIHLYNAGGLLNSCCLHSLLLEMIQLRSLLIRFVCLWNWFKYIFSRRHQMAPENSCRNLV